MARAGAPRARRPVLGASSLSLLGLVFVVLAFVVPLVLIMLRSFTEAPGGLHWYGTFLGSEGYLRVLGTTFEVAVLTTLACLVLGLPFAWCMTIASPRLRTLLTIALMLPLWTSLLVRTYAWLVILSPKGLVNSMLMNIGLIGEPLKLVHNSTGVLIGMTQIMLPMMVLPMYAVMRSVDMRLVSAAQSLGARPAVAFYTVYLPLVMPGIMVGAVIVFIVSLGFFVTPQILGNAQSTMLAQIIEQQFSKLLNWGLGSAMSTVLLVLTLVVLAVAAKTFGIGRLLRR
ncbi:ABC transporter permease [Streptosporangium sp. CA-115845]|uniref:ABC transporter permease n=1 Tax=Streptosporangium sp. CA-115845 TaxID=3240071 RepID=UPI003D944FA9